MMPTTLPELLHTIRSSVQNLIMKPIHLVGYLAGGGTELIPLLTSVPGSGQIVSKLSALWSRSCVDDVIGYVPQTAWTSTPTTPFAMPSVIKNVDQAIEAQAHACLPQNGDLYRVNGYTSTETALALATQAWNEAAMQVYGASSKQPMGLGLTATLIGKEGPHRGGHIVHVCIRSGPSGNQITCGQMVLDPGHLTREEESQLAAVFALNELLNVNRIQRWGTGLLQSMVLSANTCVMGAENRYAACELWEEYFYACNNLDPSPVPDLNPDRYFLYPITGNPWHWGHGMVMNHMQKVTGKRGIYQISRQHPIKGCIPDDILQAAIASCFVRGDLIVTDTPNDGLFREKAEKWGLDLIMGGDAFGKMIQNDRFDLNRIADLNVKLYVLGRKGNGVGSVMHQLYFDNYRTAVYPIWTPNWNVSSTEIRNQSDQR